MSHGIRPVASPLAVLLPLAAGVVAAAGLRGAAPHGASPGIERAGWGHAYESRVAITDPMILPGFRYLGNPSCTGGDCHSAESATDQSGQMIGDEFNIWAASDPHREAFNTLFDAASKEIAAKMNLADASASDRCLSCHATIVPGPQRGEQFVLSANAVGCEVCHGPGGGSVTDDAKQGYKDPHADAGWTAKERARLGSEGLRREWGLIDTTDLAVRASMCVSCHLQIDKDLLDAGHPPLQFEMYAYNYYAYDATKGYDYHWDDSKVEWINAKLWAIGQAASWEAAKKQVEAWKAKEWDTAVADALVKMYGAGAAIAKTHFGADTPEGLLKGTYSLESCKAAAIDLAALAPQATTLVERKNIALGVAALCQAWFTASGAPESPEAFLDAWDAWEAALADDHDAWTRGVEAMLKTLDE